MDDESGIQEPADDTAGNTHAAGSLDQSDEFPTDCKDLLSFESLPAQKQIEAYLRLKPSDLIVRLAATMAPKLDAFDPVDLVNRALALENEVECGLIRRRRDMVKLMKPRTLLSLISRLGVVPADETPANILVRREKLVDPVIAPAFRQLLKFLSAVRQSEKIVWPTIPEILDEFDQDSRIKRPPVPCSLRQALLYAVGDSKVDWEAIRNCYLAYLDLSTTFDDNGIEVALPAGSADFSMWWPTRVADVAENRKVNLRPDMDYEDLDYINSEILRNSVPCDFDSKKAVSEIHLVRLIGDFRAFWDEHGDSYKQNYAAKRPEQEVISARHRDLASKAAARRDFRKWTECTQQFVVFLKDRTLPQKLNEFRVLAAEFSKTKSGPSTADARKKVEEFLATLCTLHSGDAHDVLNILQRSRVNRFWLLPDDEQKAKIQSMELSDAEKLRQSAVPKCFEVFKSVTEETVAACQNLLKPVFEPDGAKKTKKRF